MINPEFTCSGFLFMATRDKDGRLICGKVTNGKVCTRLVEDGNMYCRRHTRAMEKHRKAITNKNRLYNVPNILVLETSPDDDTLLDLVNGAAVQHAMIQKRLLDMEELTILGLPKIKEIIAKLESAYAVLADDATLTTAEENVKNVIDQLKAIDTYNNNEKNVRELILEHAELVTRHTNRQVALGNVLTAEQVAVIMHKVLEACFRVYPDRDKLEALQAEFRDIFVVPALEHKQSNFTTAPTVHEEFDGDVVVQPSDIQ